MLAALLVDLDGTLVATNALHARAFVDAFAEAGVVVPVSAVMPHIGLGADRLVGAILGPDTPDGQAEALAARHTAIYIDRYAARATLRAGALDLLAAARRAGLNLALATASKQDELDAVARAAGLDLDAFDAVLTADDVENAKPSPDVIAAACKKLGVDAAATALVGDTPFDALAARRGGSVLLGVENGTHTREVVRCAGARGVWSGPGDLARAFEQAMRLASPGPHVLTAATLDALMDAALDVAEATLGDGGVPFGAVVARPDGTVVARAGNRGHTTGSPIAHAESEALRQAGARLSEHDDLVLVATVEPCAMCFGAALAARIDTVAYALAAPENGATARLDGPTRGPAVLPRTTHRAHGRDRSRDLFVRYAALHPGNAFVARLLADTA